MSCPDLDSLFDPLGIADSKRHIESCVDCQRLVVMAASVGGDAGPTAHCHDAELRIATLATGPLQPADDHWLREHLGRCRRCSNVARAVLLDPPASEIHSRPLGAIGEKTIRAAIPIAALAVVMVFVLVLITRIDRDDQRPVVAALPVDGTAAPIDAAADPEVAAPAPVDAASVENETTPAGGPTTAVEQRQARAAIQAAVHGGSLAAAYAGCDKVRGVRWLKKCVALACRSRSEVQARRYMARLPKRSRPPFINLCMAQGVVFD